MNKISPRFARAIEAAKAWPVDRQDVAAEVLERLDKLDSSPFRLDPDERADLEEALQEARRGDFASEEEVAAMFERHDL